MIFVTSIEPASDIEGSLYTKLAEYIGEDL